MSRFYSHINTAKTILSIYNGNVPFAIFLKQFFAKEKKYGSRDRKIISSLCYNCFRTGSALSEKPADERLLISMFLCSNSQNQVLENVKPEWNEKVTLPLAEKIEITGIDLKKIFTFSEELSAGADAGDFNVSFLIQPRLFARLRPAKHEKVKQKLTAAQINFTEVNDTCLAFANSTRLEDVIDIDKEAVIQDLNSQRTGEFISAVVLPEKASVWDCCAASGGKSILAHDLIENLQLTVSDVRESIIQNLEKRFKKADIKDYSLFVADLVDYKNLHEKLRDKKFDLIICDAPCSGSGTWSRTPEQLTFFNKKDILKYSILQRNICANTIPFLKKGGYFLYITCSVFKKENEEIVGFIQQQTSLSLVKSELLTGYHLQADTMFAALFHLPF